MFDFFFFFIDIHEWLFYVDRKTSTFSASRKHRKVIVRCPKSDVLKIFIEVLQKDGVRHLRIRISIVKRGGIHISSSKIKLQAESNCRRGKSYLKQCSKSYG